MRFMLDLATQTESLLLATATPIQMHRMELYDLMSILHRGCERVLGRLGRPWAIQRNDAMDMIAGVTQPPSSIAQIWTWLRDPLVPMGEHPVATQVRAELGVPDPQTSAPPDSLDRLGMPLRLRLQAAGNELLLHHNPFVRHVIKRRRKDLRTRETPATRNR
jgi:hypothetical protein